MTELYLESPEFEAGEKVFVEPELLRSPRRRRWRPTDVLAWAAALVAVVLAVVAATGVADDVGERQGGELDLVASLPPLYWAAVGLAVVTTVIVLWRGSGQSILTLLVPLWIALVHLTPDLVAGSPLPTGSQATIERSRRLSADGLAGDGPAGELMAEAPGFFGLVSVVAGDLSGPALEWTVRLWSVLVTGVLALLVSALASRSFPRTDTAGPLAALVYVFISWFGTGELVSSSVGLMLLVASLVLVETGRLQADPGAIGNLRLLSSQTASVGDRPDSYSIPVFAALLLVTFGALASDSFMPAAVCSSFFVLAIYGRRVARRLWLLSVVGFTAWTLLAGRPWWTNRLVELQDGFDYLAASLSGGGPEVLVSDQVLAWVGVLTVSFVAVCGVLMSIDRFSGLRPTAPIVPLALAVVVASTVTYSTESLGSQVLALTSPFAAVLAGRMLSAAGRAGMAVVVPVLIVFAVPIFLIVRLDGGSDDQAIGIQSPATSVAAVDPGVA